MLPERMATTRRSIAFTLLPSMTWSHNSKARLGLWLTTVAPRSMKEPRWLPGILLDYVCVRWAGSEWDGAEAWGWPPVKGERAESYAARGLVADGRVTGMWEGVGGPLIARGILYVNWLRVAGLFHPPHVHT